MATRKERKETFFGRKIEGITGHEKTHGVLCFLK
jgi:hypothetical protein